MPLYSREETRNARASPPEVPETGRAPVLGASFLDSRCNHHLCSSDMLTPLMKPWIPSFSFMTSTPRLYFNPGYSSSDLEIA